MIDVSSARDDGSYDGQPRSPKRAKLDHDRNFTGNTDREYRRRSPPRRGPNHGRSRSYSNPNDQEMQGEARIRDDRLDEHNQRQRSASPGRRIQVNADRRKKNKKSARDRKQNPSTRIHSLRNILARGGLPARVHQEKERELAGLLFDQQKDSIKNDAKKNLKRYHFIRFIERQKATRNVKRLTNMKKAGNATEDLERQLHEAEVDLNYTLYCPLAQKYIALFARDGSEPGKPLPLSKNLSRMNKRDKAILSDEQQYQIEQYSMEAANMLHMSDSVQGAKPPLWYAVEAKMQEGQKALEEFRDEKPKVDLTSDLVMGKGAKSTPDWLNDAGMIDPKDLDSDSNEDGGVGINSGIENDEMSDGDGGFFEKR